MAKKRFNSSSSPSQRTLRVGELIRRTLSEMLMRGDVHDPDLTGINLTVTEVKISADLRVATVYVMPLGGDGREEAIAALARNAGQMRHRIGKEITLRHTPELRFMIDETFDQMDRTRELLSQERVRRDIDKDEES